MAEAAVLASGNGSNFEALTHYLNTTEHRICCLICDREKAYALERAKRLSIPGYYIPGWGKNREAAETEALRILQDYNPHIVILAGFMRVLTPLFLDAWPNKVVNIHPSLLPKYPGTRGIEDSYASGDREVGITIHLVDSGVDTGPVLLQKKIL
ncbi:MAG: phosphoribosylglycinamide formyltransferase, partial [Spirochaetales bacterium]|nr:phosphoribosylglycinamide formyltransferase [Spirochaetales bacterium]